MTWLISLGKASNFSNLNDELELILCYLTAREKTTSFRFVSRKFNKVFAANNNPIISDLNATQLLLFQLRDEELDELAMNAIIDEIAIIHHRNVFNEQYSIIFPFLMHEWYQNNHINTTYKKYQLRLALSWLEADDRGSLDGSDQFDDATQALIMCSRGISVALAFDHHVSIASNPWLNCMKLAYQHCWVHLFAVGKLPAFYSVYYLNDNQEINPNQTQFLMNLIDAFKLNIIHPKFLNMPWRNVEMHILHYLKAQNDLVEAYDDGMEMPKANDIWLLLDTKWMIRRLQSISV